ncbi:GrpB family protein [Natronosalvus rutilus]|uniref:GrpB family protein n=1 Tax=Natronosalvus rutilus TaxID=2953753 RepID=A0A9E7NDU1_9EURY|nr:GrpB family protein [Natronosalvus rutilus]UTF55114.1 GrpB family protein [Natronosalvus rutilus]
MPESSPPNDCPPNDGPPLGLARGTVALVSHHPGWLDAAVAELERLEQAFERDGVDDRVLGYEHVGSTAVPGLAAKPILDLLVLVADLEAVTSLQPALERLGYERQPNDGVPDRVFFAKGPETDRMHYLSVASWGSDCHREQVVFRDFMCDNPSTAEAYETLKRQLAGHYLDERAAYTDRKEPFVEEILEWAVSAGYDVDERP